MTDRELLDAIDRIVARGGSVDVAAVCGAPCPKRNKHCRLHQTKR